MDTIARTGSFAAAARELGKVPSALTYSVRQLEDALDVLLFDRSSRQAQLTAAGSELLRRGPAPAAARSTRWPTACAAWPRGWETQLTIAVDGHRLAPTAVRAGARPSSRSARRRPWRRRRPGHAAAPAHRGADRHLGGAGHRAGRPGDRRRRRTHANPGGIELRPLGELAFVFCVAPHHPLAAAAEPLTDARARCTTAPSRWPTRRSAWRPHDREPAARAGRAHRADHAGQARGAAARPGLRLRARADGARRTWRPAGWCARRRRAARASRTLHYAWRADARRDGRSGRALQWWLAQLESPTTRRALLERHAGPLR